MDGIDPSNRPEQRQNDWEECKKFIHGSSVLIIPVESSSYGSNSSNRAARLSTISHSEEIKEIVMDWAKFRNNEHANEPSTIIFAPVKCESYLTDNGFTSNKDKSEDLKRLVEHYYSEVIQSAEKDFRHNQQILYSILFIQQ